MLVLLVMLVSRGLKDQLVVLELPDRLGKLDPQVKGEMLDLMVILDKWVPLEHQEHLELKDLQDSQG